MQFWKVKKGNTSIQEMEVKDKKGVRLTNLASATAVTFQVKKDKTDVDAEIEKTKGDGIEVDTPSIGFLRITLKPTDTNLKSADYYMGLQIEWGPADIWEVKILINGDVTDRFIIEQDIVEV